MLGPSRKCYSQSEANKNRISPSRSGSMTTLLGDNYLDIHRLSPLFHRNVSAAMRTSDSVKSPTNQDGTQSWNQARRLRNPLAHRRRRRGRGLKETCASTVPWPSRFYGASLRERPAAPALRAGGARDLEPQSSEHLYASRHPPSPTCFAVVVRRRRLRRTSCLRRGCGLQDNKEERTQLNVVINWFDELKSNVASP